MGFLLWTFEARFEVADFELRVGLFW